MTEVTGGPTAKAGRAQDTVQGDSGVGPRELVVLISSVMALMALGLDLILPAFDEVRDAFDLGEGSSQVGQVITFYFFGLAVAQLGWGPLADRFGRKPVLYVGIALYMAGAAASALAPTFSMLLGARVLWGMGAAASRVVATAIIRDQFVGDRMAKVMSQIMAVFVIVPVIAPTFGALIVAVLPWQAIFWFCAVWAAGIAFWSLRLHETLDPAHVRPLSGAQVGRNYLEVLRIGPTMLYTTGSTFIQVVFTLYLATSELMISEIFDRGDQFPVIFGVIAIGFGVSALINGRMVERFGIQRMLFLGLTIAVVFSAIATGLAVAGDGQPNFWLFMPAMGLVLSSFMMLMPNMNTAALAPVGHIAGSASAFTSAIRIGIGSAIAGVLTGFVEDSVTPFAVASLVMVALTGVTIVVVTRQRETRSATP